MGSGYWEWVVGIGSGSGSGSGESAVDSVFLAPNTFGVGIVHTNVLFDYRAGTACFLIFILIFRAMSATSLINYFVFF